MSNKIVIIPTYNEKDNIELIINAIFSLKVVFDILIIDDNSPDNTAEIIKNLQKKFIDKLYLEIQKKKMGLGQAYIHGFQWVLKKNYTYIFQMDADFSHNPSDLIRLYEACKTYDMVIGSRYYNGINVVHWSIYRVLLSYFASKYVKLITGLPIQDTTAGFICYKQNTIRNIPFKKVNCSGYLFQIKMKYFAWKKGFKIKEIPIIFTNRYAGSSKMNKKIIKEAFWGVILLKLQSLFK